MVFTMWLINQVYEAVFFGKKRYFQDQFTSHKPMIHPRLYAFILLAAIGSAQGQQPEKPTATDTWSNVPSAPDDRFTNPKSKLYAGPNGWYNYGEVRATVANAAKTSYTYKGSFQIIQGMLTVTTSNLLYVLTFDFGTANPASGTYQTATTANATQNKVKVAFGDVSGQKIKEWTAEAGTVQVSVVNGFVYVKCRNVALQPSGLHNTGDFKSPLTLGFEGALKPD